MATSTEKKVYTGHEEINSNCLALYKEIIKKHSSLIKKSPGDEILQKCKLYLTSLKKTSSYMNMNITQKKEWLKLYTQVVLDLTFHEENQIVEEEFAEPHGPVKMDQIIGDLTLIEKLSARVMGQELTVCDFLGEDLAECLKWRCGALCYMYCATLEKRKTFDKHRLCKCACEGVHHLQAMLNVRTPLGSTDDVEVSDKDVAALLQNGIFSDTHMLALMYCGELCYWYIQYSKDGEVFHSTHHHDFSPKDTGMKMLQRYIKMAVGPLKLHGWATERAQDLFSQIDGQT